MKIDIFKPIKKIKKHCIESVVNKRRSEVSDIKLKDLILQSNKVDVVNSAFNYISKDGMYEYISELITTSKDYICPINKCEYLENAYDLMYLLAEKEYLNNETINYVIRTGQGFPFGFDEFLDVIYIDENLESTGKFIVISEINENVLPLEFMLSCRVDKVCLDISNTEFVALCLLQIIYIQELNKY